ncbi:MAG: hypothetical protein KDA84_14765 [Planctomycetaceae bacterium]|nr:hypothetical protein [Planctomycetaceae bacterium]
MPDLNCTEFEAQLELLVEDHRTLEDLSDETTDPRAKAWRDLRAHANGCDHCRQHWNDFALLERVIAPWKERTPTVNLADAVLGRWKEENHSFDQSPPSQSVAQDRSTFTKRSLWSMLLMVAVALLISFRFWHSPQTKEELPPTYDIVKVDPKIDPDQELDAPEILAQNTPHREELEAEMDWETVAEDARSAYWVLASDTADSFATVSVLVPPQKPKNPQEPVPADKPKKGWTEELGSGWKPISQDIGRATGFLLDALPQL